MSESQVKVLADNKAPLVRVEALGLAFLGGTVTEVKEVVDTGQLSGVESHASCKNDKDSQGELKIHKSDLVGLKGFVSGLIPGEEALVRVDKLQGNLFHGSLVNLINKSADRISPPCPYVERCGGCHLQHMAYQAQLVEKRNMVASALRSGGIPEGVISTLKEIVPSSPLGYRRRLSLHIDKEGRVGLFARSSREIIELDSCLQADPLISAALPRLKPIGQSLVTIGAGLSLETDGETLVGVVKLDRELSSALHSELSHKLGEVVQGGIIEVKGREVARFGQTELEMDTGYSVPAGSFSQVNSGVNLKLVKRVLDCAAQLRAQRILDLYSGAGNFALPLARDGAYVTAVESSTKLVKTGDTQAMRRGLGERVSFVNLSVEAYFKMGSSAKFDLIVADPPRSGLGVMSRRLNQSENLILISCHLAACIRDIQLLIADGWTVESIEPFDMFAQTTYLEILTVLRRPSSRGKPASQSG